MILTPSKTGRRVLTSSMQRSVVASSLKVTNAKPVQCRCRLTRDRNLASRSEICRLASASRAWMRLGLGLGLGLGSGSGLGSGLGLGLARLDAVQLPL